MSPLSPAYPFTSAPTQTPKRISILSASLRNYSLGRAHRVRNSFKFLFRALGQPRVTRAWLARLVQADIAPLWELRPRLAIKLQRPYLSSEFGATERCAALLGHYHLLPQRLNAAALRAVYTHGLTVLELHHTASSRRLNLTLAYRNEFEMEGELTLSVVDAATGLTLAGITFCLAHNLGKRVAIIGGLQATRDERTRTIIHDLAKELHGLRAKAFALWSLQQVIAAWEIDEIQAVCDEQHIYKHWRKRKDIAASYDEFWAESDGQRLPGGGWELPRQLRQRSREELKPSRRKQHERRYEFLNALQPVFTSALLQLQPAAPTLPSTVPVFTFASREADGASTPPHAKPSEPRALDHSF